MAPKRATRSTRAPPTPNETTTTVTEAQLQALIDQGVAAAMAEAEASRARNGYNSNALAIAQQLAKSNSPCTLLAGALTWWNSHVMTVTHDVAYSMTWVDLKKKMTDKYCPRNEMKKLEAELWNLKVIGTDVVKYNQRFQELDPDVRMFPEEADKIERYVGGLLDMIHGNIVASKPKIMQEAIEMAIELMDNRVSTIAERQAENKRKVWKHFQNNQEPNTTNKTRDKTPAGHTLLDRVIRNHMGDLDPYAQNAITTMTVRVLQSAINVTNMVTSLVTVGVREMPTTITTRRAPDRVRNLLVRMWTHTRALQKGMSKLKTNKGNCVINARMIGSIEGVMWLEMAGQIQTTCVADRKVFVSTAFSSQIDITPSTLDHYYDVELADGRIIGLNTILKGCTLNFINHQFNINLMPVELGSFDAIIGMDWLAKHQAVIACAEKIVRIPWKDNNLNTYT
ncbi:putative reverse transcriptase domain-containing protein [Tanacetum coccineum]